MKSLLLSGLILMSLTVEARDKDRDDHQKEHGGRKNFEVIALNSPVKETMVKFLLKGPSKITKVFLVNKHGGKKEFEATLEQTPSGYVASFKGSALKVGAYEYKVRALVPNEHHGHNKHDQECQKGLVDHVRFAIDPSLEVADPGPEGEKTLLGIDSDKDGVRDDVQRWINEEYSMSKSPSTNHALKQIAIYYERAIGNINNKAQAVMFHNKSREAYACLRWIKGLDEGGRIEKMLHLKSVNTSERIKAEIRLQEYQRGSSCIPTICETELENRSRLCEFKATKE